MYFTLIWIQTSPNKIPYTVTQTATPDSSADSNIKQALYSLNLP